MRWISGIMAVVATVFLASCASGPGKKDLAPNICAETENSTADFADVVDDSGTTIISLHFRCVFQRTDTNMPLSLNPKAHALELNKAGKNLKKMTQIEDRYEKTQEKYLTGKCPKNWTGEVVWEPFGWKCFSEEIPLTKACTKGKPLKLANSSGKKELACVTNPKYYPGALIQ